MKIYLIFLFVLSFLASGQQGEASLYLEQDISSLREGSINCNSLENHLNSIEDVNVPIDDTGQTLLMKTISLRCDELSQKLLDGGADPNIQDNNGNTALMFIRYPFLLLRTALLLESGADPNIQNNDGWTPIMFAVHRFDLDQINLLLSFGADSTDIKRAIRQLRESGTLKKDIDE